MPKEYSTVVSTRYGKIRGIDEERLIRILNDLVKPSLGLDKDAYVPGYGIHLGSVELASTDTKAPRKAVLLKLVGSPVTPESAKLVQFPREWCSDAMLCRVAASIERCFDIGTERSYSETVQYALTNLRDFALAAIREKRPGSLARVATIYVQLGSEFLRELQDRGDGFTLDQAQSESRSLFEGWRDVDWIRENLEDLLSMSLNSGDRDIVETVLHIPVNLMAEAIKYGDLYVFNSFRSYPSMIYRYVACEKAQQNRTYLIDHCHRQLSDICNYVLVARLRTMDPQLPPRRLVEFAVASLLTFQELLVQSLLARDADSFQLFYDASVKLLPWGAQFQEPPSIQTLRAWLTEPLPPDKRKYYELRIAFLQERENQLLHFDARKEQMLFGVAGFTFEHLLGEPENPSLNAIYQIVSRDLPRRLPGLCSLFAKCYDIKITNFWNWDGWYLPKQETDTFDSFGPLLRMFVFELLRRVQASDAATIRNLSIEDRAAARLLCSVPELRATIGRVFELARSLGFQLPDPADDKMAAFYEFLDRLKQEEETGEEAEALASTPSPEMRRRFADGAIQGIKSESTVRAILRFEPSAYRDLTRSRDEIPESVTRFGLKRLAGKKALLREPERAYEALGLQFGIGIGRGENASLLRTITQAMTSAGEVTAEGAGELLDRVLADLKEDTLSHWVVIVLECFPVIEFWRAQKRLRELSNTLHQSREATIFPEGYYGDFNVPVFHLYGTGMSSRVLVLDPARFGVLTQYAAAEPNEQGGVVAGDFFVRLRDLNVENDLRQEVLNNNRAQLERQADPDYYLRLALLVEVFERFTFVVNDPQRGRSLTIKA